jgi:hypothetical protein
MTGMMVVVWVFGLGHKKTDLPCERIGFGVCPWLGWLVGEGPCGLGISRPASSWVRVNALFGGAAGQRVLQRQPEERQRTPFSNGA